MIKVNAAISDQVLIDKIVIIRGQKVMFDRDLADLYGVKTDTTARTGKAEHQPVSRKFHVSING